MVSVPHMWRMREQEREQEHVGHLARAGLRTRRPVRWAELQPAGAGGKGALRGVVRVPRACESLRLPKPPLQTPRGRPPHPWTWGPQGCGASGVAGGLTSRACERVRSVSRRGAGGGSAGWLWEKGVVTRPRGKLEARV